MPREDRLAHPADANRSNFLTLTQETVYDRRNLKPLIVPPLPFDLNNGYDRFVDRDRTNPYPAPLLTLVEALASVGNTDALRSARFVTWRWVRSLTHSPPRACGSRTGHTHTEEVRTKRAQPAKA
jgi:hypothetical protein